MNKFLYFICFFSIDSLIASDSNSLVSQEKKDFEPKMEIVYQVEYEDGRKSFQDVPEKDNVYQEALDLYNQALQADSLTVEGAKRVTLIVDIQSDSIYAAVEFSGNRGGGDFLRMDGNNCL